ncbi:glycosyltransferase, partial [Planctomycetota bacterium]
VVRSGRYRHRVLLTIGLLVSALRNWRIVRKLLRASAPDVVVVGSDLGNLNIRFLMDACRSCGIPVVILYNCDLPKANSGSRRRFLPLWKDMSVLRSSVLSLLRAVLFGGTTPGEYASDSIVCVPSQDICEELVARGIDRNRIVVTGLPSPSPSPSVDGSAREVCGRLGIEQDRRLVVLFTECIQNIYGMEYAKDVYERLADAVRTLPNDVLFLVKLHPIESGEIESLLRRIFHGSCSRTRIIAGEFAAETLVGVAALCVAHFSRVLITAAQMGRRFLSINLMRDRDRTFISSDESGVLEIDALDDLGGKIRSAIEDVAFKDQIDRLISSIAGRFSDPDCCEKMASVILGNSRSVATGYHSHNS